MNFQTAHINWRDGMLLLPEHFKHSDQSMQRTIEDQMKAQVYYWGILKFDIDTNALTESHIFSIKKAKFRMKSGVWVDIPGNSYADFESFREYTYDHHNPLPVWLGIYRQNSEDASKTDSIPIDDSINSNQHSEIQIQRRRVKIFFEAPSNEYESIQVGEITRSQYSEMPVFNDSYIPPLMDFNASHVLKKKLNKLVLTLKDQSEILRNTISKPYFFKKNDNATSLKMMSMAQVETSSWLILSQLEQTEGIHPYVLYMELIRLLGSLIVYQFSELDMIPLYQHNQLFHTYDQLFELLDQLFDKEKKTNIESRNFINNNEDRWLCRLDREWLFGENIRFYICVNTERLKNPTDNYLYDEGIIVAPKSRIDALFAQRKEGFKYKRAKPVPPGLPDRSDLQYYRLNIDPDDVLWDLIKRDPTLVLRGLNSVQVPEIKLYVEKDQEK